jgi:hypothetical protein
MTKTWIGCRRGVAFTTAAALFFGQVGAATAAPGTARAPARAPAAQAAAATPTPPPAPPGPKPLAETLTGDAKADYDAAKLLYGDKDFDGSLVKFQHAYDVSHDPRLFWNIAACEKNLRHYARALLMLQYYKKEGGALITEQDQQDATDMLGMLQPFVARAKIDSNEAGATVFVDDLQLGTTPLAEPLLVDIGTRHFRVTKEGFRDFNSTLTVAGSGDIVIEARLAPDVHQGKLVVRASPKDAIAVDGKAVGVGEWEGALDSGGHTLRVTAQGMRPYQTEVVIADNQTRGMTVALDPEPEIPKPEKGGSSAWIWVTGGLLLAGGAGVGGYFLLANKSHSGSPPAGTLGTVPLAIRFH